MPFLSIPTLTAILQVAYPDKYGVWNRTSMEGMALVGLWDDRWEKNLSGVSYLWINNLYLELSNVLDVDLWTLDALWWVVKKG